MSTPCTAVCTVFTPMYQPTVPNQIHYKYIPYVLDTRTGCTHLLYLTILLVVPHSTSSLLLSYIIPTLVCRYSDVQHRSYEVPTDISVVSCFCTYIRMFSIGFYSPRARVHVLTLQTALQTLREHDQKSWVMVFVDLVKAYDTVKTSPSGSVGLEGYLAP